ncbi:hypothetical protein NQ176_g9229 [Zarea fungicola]|uniref:Uncharacterized protein n=1 Tax=Zarea fungicola TaxID=93591 RepID=A0ACC1MPX5_9HYPO|nr:hypothetical protein NQ176_g9229 [Lecanicillium fungicola]
MSISKQSSLPIVVLFSTAAVLANPIIPQATAIGGSCTSTTYQAANIAPAPPATWQPTWTVTVHTATTTSTVAVDCGGCSHLDTSTVMINYLYPSGPRPMVIETLEAPEPSVVTVAHCASPPPNQPTAPRLPPRLDSDDKSSATSCPKRLFHAPHFTWGPTRTVWTSTTTVTQEVDCGGCSDLQIFHIPSGPGPAVARLGVMSVVNFHL